MKLYDALRTDSELRQEVQDLFDAERQQSLQRIESAKPDDLPALQAERLYLSHPQTSFLFLQGGIGIVADPVDQTPQDTATDTGQPAEPVTTSALRRPTSPSSSFRR